MLLGKYAICVEGLSTGDSEQFIMKFWEIDNMKDKWDFFIQNVDNTIYFGGRTDLVKWENGTGSLHKYSSAHNFPSSVMHGVRVLGGTGIRITQMGKPKSTLYCGEIFGKSGASLIVRNISNLPAV
jgi:hypothetical protein